MSDARISDDWEVRRLTRQVARQNASALLAIHNIIPMVMWAPADLLAGGHGDRIYRDKWVHSRAIFHRGTGAPAGLMIAYDREASDVFPHRSLYLHRGAIAQPQQRLGLGRLLFESYTNSPPPPIGPRWLTLQTNANAENSWIVNFYRRLGFEVSGTVLYPNKTDFLLSKRWV